MTETTETEAPPPPRVALVTGGSKGLGAGLVDGFLNAGYCVETCSRSKTDTVRAWEDDPELKERFHFTTADVSDGEDASDSSRRPPGAGAASTRWSTTPGSPAKV